jgi:ferrous iron transport protein B
LVGNPNCGKTALFNILTGSRQKVANYAGVTVERKEGSLLTPSGMRIRILDLPGAYSLDPLTPDEQVTADVLLGRRAGETQPDFVVCVTDATNLRQNLRLVLSLKRLGLPMVVALNMSDIARRKGIVIDANRLSQELGVPVVETVGVKTHGVRSLVQVLNAAVSPARGNNAAEWLPLSALDIEHDQAEVRRILGVVGGDRLEGVTFSDRVDAFVLHPVLGTAILALILFLVFQAVFAWAQVPMDAIKSAVAALGTWLGEALPASLLKDLLINGILAGAGSVLVFLPQIIILFFFILILEDSGYLPRAAFLLDRVMGSVGLSGRAFIPLLSSFACAIPGVMATRVIDNRRDRLTTILIAPLMTCSARIPVYTLIISAFIPDEQAWGWVNLRGLVMFGLYAAGISSALGVSFLIKFFMLRDYAPAPFMLELPDYKLPRLKSIAIGIYTRAKMFLQRAGTTIFSMMVLIWFLASFPAPPVGADQPAINYSLAAILGHGLAPLFAPLGFNWQIVVALIPGMAAREVAVAALGTVYAIEGGKEAADQIGQVLATKWSLATALSLLAWYVFAPQCASTLAVIRRETGGTKWMALTFVYMFVLAYAASLVTYHVAVVIGAG